MAFTNTCSSLLTSATERQQLRQHYRRRREQLSNAEQMAAAKSIHRHLVHYIELQKPRAVGVFLAANGEPSLTPFIHTLWQRNITVALPVLHPVCPGHLLFLRYLPNTPMITNRFNIAEPRLQCQTVVPLTELQLLCMPLVAFDSNGNRIRLRDALGNGEDCVYDLRNREIQCTDTRISGGVDAVAVGDVRMHSEGYAAPVTRASLTYSVPPAR